MCLNSTICSSPPQMTSRCVPIRCGADSSSPCKGPNNLLPHFSSRDRVESLDSVTANESETDFATLIEDQKIGPKARQDAW